MRDGLLDVSRPVDDRIEILTLFEVDRRICCNNRCGLQPINEVDRLLMISLTPTGTHHDWFLLQVLS